MAEAERAEAGPGGADKEHRAVSRVAAILEAAAAAEDGITLARAAHDLGAPKSSVYGLIKGLVAVGYLIEGGGRYQLGPGIQALVLPSQEPPLAKVARDAMARLRLRFDESVSLGLRAGDSIVYLASHESRQIIKYSVPLNQRRPLFPTSMGKIYLAELSEQQLERYLGTRVSDPAALDRYLAEFRQIRRTGVALNHGETVPEVFGAASGIRRRGKLVACVSLAGPTERLQCREAEIADAVRAAATEISALLR